MNCNQFRVLFLAERNSSRSILAEALLNRLGAGRFEAFSAGVTPAAAISPYAIALLHRINYNPRALEPKAIEAFAGEDAPPFDFIFRLSHHMPSSRLSLFGGAPHIIDWFLPDPEDVIGSSAMIATAYADLFGALCSRIETLTQMSPDFLRSEAGAARLERMGETYIRLAA